MNNDLITDVWTWPGTVRVSRSRVNAFPYLVVCLLLMWHVMHLCVIPGQGPPWADHHVCCVLYCAALLRCQAF